MVLQSPTRNLITYAACAIAGWLVLGGAGCSPDFNRLSAGTGGSTGGSTVGGNAGSVATAGASATGGTAGAQAGNGGATAGGAGSAGVGASGGSTAGSGGSAAGTSSGGAGTGAGGGGGSGSGGISGNSGAGGEAGVQCTAGMTSCSGESTCTNLNVGEPQGATVTDCGSCGVTCSVTNATGADCSNGACSPNCKTGFGDCNAQAANDGCETDITVVDNCGKCGYVCSRFGTTSAACTFGKCAPVCAPYMGNCNTPTGADDGCETYLDSLTQCRPSCTTASAPCGALQTCTAGVCGPAQGLAVFSVPFDATNKDQRYADTFVPPLDLTNAQFLMRVYAPGATSGQLTCYFSDSVTSAAGGGGTFQLTDFAAGWKEVTLNVGPSTTAPAFNAASIKQLTIEVVSGTTAWTPDPMVIYVDAIRTTNGIVNDTFDTTAAPKVVKSSVTAVPGATLAWASALP